MPDRNAVSYLADVTAGIAISRLTRQVRHRWCRRPALLPWLSSSPQSGAPEIIPAG
jgi:hypothetical protein